MIITNLTTVKPLNKPQWPKLHLVGGVCKIYLAG